MLNNSGLCLRGPDFCKICEASQDSYFKYKQQYTFVSSSMQFTNLIIAATLENRWFAKLWLGNTTRYTVYL